MIIFFDILKPDFTHIDFFSIGFCDTSFWGIIFFVEILLVLNADMSRL